LGAGRSCPEEGQGDCFLRVKDATSPSCSTAWMNSAMVWRGVCLTRSFSESPSADEECSLSDVLESHAPERFFLSPRAAAGILRRAEKRGRTLPSRLQAALESLATGRGEEQRTTSTSSPQLFPVDSRSADTAQRDQWLRISPTSSFSRPSLPSGPKAQADQREMSTTTSPSHITSTPQTPASTSGTPMNPKGPEALTDAEDSLRNRAGQLSVRRLTPTECEVLQAFPKGWTVPDIEHWGTRSRRKSPSGSEEES